MAVNPYTGKFGLMETLQQIGPLIMQYLMFKEMQKMGEPTGEENALGQLAGVGMASPESMGGIAGSPQMPPMGGMSQMPKSPNFNGIPGQAPPSLMGQPFSSPGGADISRLGQMSAMQQMMGRGQNQFPAQIPQQQPSQIEKNAELLAKVLPLILMAV